MDDLLTTFEQLSVTNSIIYYTGQKLVSKVMINNGTVLYDIKHPKLKYFWEVYPDQKTITINNDIVLDLTDDNTVFKYIEQAPYYYNTAIEYCINYSTGEMYDFKIKAIRNIYEGDEIILRYNISDM